MRAYQILQSGSNQELKIYSDVGVPQGGMVTLFSPSNSTIKTGTFSSGSLSQSFNGVMEGQDSITVSNTSNAVVGDRAILKNTVSGREMEIKIIDKTATTITLDQSVRYDIPTGSIESHELTLSLDPSDIGTVYRFCRAVWTITGSAGNVVRRMHRVDIVKNPFEILINEGDIETIDPTFGSTTSNKDSWKDLREAAVDAVWDELTGEGIYPDLTMNREMLKTAAIYKLLELYYLPQNIEDFGATETRSDKYLEKFDLTMNKFLAGKYWYDKDDDESLDGADGTGSDEDFYTDDDGNELDGVTQWLDFVG